MDLNQFVLLVLNQQRLVINKKGRPLEQSKAKDKRRRANRIAKVSRKRNNHK